MSRSISNRLIIASTLIAAGLTSVAGAQTLNPILTFGTNGYLASGGASTLLTINNEQRALTFNPVTGNIIMPHTGNSVRVINGTTGVELAPLTMPSLVGISANRGVNSVAVAADGAIYVANLQAIVSVANPAVIFRWTGEADVSPTQAFNGPLGTAVRFGDQLDAIGSGSSTVLVSGAGNAIANVSNGYTVFSTANGSTFTPSSVGFAGITPANSDFRLGITFGPDASTVIGAQNTASIRVSTFSGTTGTLVGTVPGQGGAGGSERGMDFTTVSGTPILGIIATGSSILRIYALNLTSPGSTTLLTSAAIQTGPFTSNGNGTSSVSFGTPVGSVVPVYALNTNNGIQAFNFDLAGIIPEPTTLGLLAGASVLILRRKKA